MKIASGFRVELFASEPLIASPVAMEFDEYGRIFVVEMPGYPLDTSGTGRVKLLEDTDGDGRPDRATIFADKLVLPTGIMRWKKGVLVTDPPNVWYLEDTDGDNRADRREVILTGFSVTNPQHTVNTPVYGLDNWIYLAHESPARTIQFQEKFGDRGGPIHFAGESAAPQSSISNDAAQHTLSASVAKEDPGRNVRFRPEARQVELLSGSSQFGHTFDAWGHHFTLNNSNHLRHEVIGPGYLQRDPYLVVSKTMQDISDHGNAAEVFPITRNPEHQMLTDIGQFTSACSLTWYLGNLFPKNYQNICFVAEPVHNLVHADVLSQLGTTFIARRLVERSEFLSSTDSWFRPVNFYIGPDGALYVVDYYRRIIEHPEWMSREVNKSENLYNGFDRGRIFRIVPDSPGTGFPKKVLLGNATDAELIRQLAGENIWARRVAQRLLVDRRTSETGSLIRLFKETPSPFARLHALWTLEGLNRLPEELIEDALRAPEPGLRENAIRLAENNLRRFPALSERLVTMENDPDPKVRLQLLCTLGNIESSGARAARRRLLFAHVEDEWMQLAGLSGAGTEAYSLFQQAISQFTTGETKARASFFHLLCADIAARNSGDETRRLTRQIAAKIRPGAEWWCSAALEGVAEGLGAAASPGIRAGSIDRELFLSLFQNSHPAIRNAALHVLETTGLPQNKAADAALARAAAISADSTQDPKLRADSIRLLRLEGADKAEKYDALWRRLLSLQEPEDVQAAAAGALARLKNDEAVKLLIERWKSMTAPVRAQAGEAFFRTPARLGLLVDALKSGAIQPWTLSERHRRRLIMNPDAAVRETVRDLLERAVLQREKVLQRYKRALNEPGNASNGAQVFKRSCSKCHQINGSGGKFGPDLNTVRAHAPEILLSDILIPSKAIAQNYEVYVLELRNGAHVDGTIAAQSPTAITLRHEDGREEAVLRRDIKEAHASAVSGMPGDLEKQIDVRQMADLIAFLRGGR